jgi:hypothetical protein
MLPFMFPQDINLMRLGHKFHYAFINISRKLSTQLLENRIHQNIFKKKKITGNDQSKFPGTQASLQNLL